MTRIVYIGAAWLSLTSCGGRDISAKRSQPETIDVRVARPRHVRIPAAIDLSGTVESRFEPTNVAFLVSGKVVSVGPREGDFVKAGSTLAIIDPTDFQFVLESAAAQTVQAHAQFEKASASARTEVVEQARSNLTLAEDEYRRMKILYDRKSLAPNDFEKYQNALTNAQQQYEQAKQGAQKEDKDAAKAAWGQAEAAERTARKRLSDATLVAPVSGYVAKRNIEPGAIAAPGTPVFTIIELDPVEIQAGVPETDIRLVHRGQKALITTSALPAMSFAGQVQLINVSAESQTRTYMTRIRVPNHDGKLLVGMIAEAHILSGGEIEVLTLPGSSIVRDPQGATQVFVYFSNEKRVYPKRVTTGAITGQDIQIVDGITDADWIVIAGQQLVREGSIVRAKEAIP